MTSGAAQQRIQDATSPATTTAAGDAPFDAADIESVRSYFARDVFATQMGCHVVAADPNQVVCDLEITPGLLNANGTVMGGALFTLGDFTLGIAANLDGNPSVSLDVNIRFLSVAKGARLIATSRVERAGRTAGFYSVDIEDDTGRLVAVLNATMSRKGK